MLLLVQVFLLPARVLSVHDTEIRMKRRFINGGLLV